jgi:predicted secreted protein
MRVALPVGAIVAALLALAPAQAQGPTRAVVVTELQNGTTVELSRGQRLVVRLATRSGTGFSWAPVAPANGVLRLAKSETRRGPSMPGAPTAQIFTLVPVVPAPRCRVHYRRPWLGDQPPGAATSQPWCAMPRKRFLEAISWLGERRYLG